MLKVIYEYLKLNFSVTGNPITDLLVGGMIFAFFNALAYKWVGDLYRVGIIGGRFAGSALNFAFKIIMVLLTMGILKVVILIKSLFA